MRNLTIAIIVIVIILLVLFCNTSEVEGFDGFGRFDGLGYDKTFTPYHHNCRNCGNLGKGRCGSCLNCGWCINESGEGMCTPGDSRGPYFKSDCVVWRHPSQFNRFKPRFHGRKFPKHRFYPNMYRGWFY